MTVLRSDKAAAQARKKAMRLFEDARDGLYDYEDEPAVAAEARGLFEAALDWHRGQDQRHQEAFVLAELGYLARHLENDAERALALLRDAIAIMRTVGSRRDRLPMWLEVGELDPADPGVVEAVDAAIAEGLPDDLDYFEDPDRLAIALREAGRFGPAIDLFERLAAEAVSRDDGARASGMVREISRIREDKLEDRRGAITEMERALALSEAAKDKEGIGAALLGLTDLHYGGGNRAKAQECFARVASMKGLPSHLRNQIEIISLTYKAF